jgi:hypothetical protein
MSFGIYPEFIKLAKVRLSVENCEYVADRSIVFCIENLSVNTKINCPTIMIIFDIRNSINFLHKN